MDVLMAAVRLYWDIRSAGGWLRVEGGKVRIDGPASLMTAELDAAIRGAKPDLVRLFTEPCPCAACADERPALKRLEEDVEAGRVDCVVVYKIDRLSRSIADFVNLMAKFDKHGVAFAAVTQQFDTSTPVGRLTLNLLTCFAHYAEFAVMRSRRPRGP